MIWKIKSITFLLVLCGAFGISKPYKILGVFPVASKSHFYIGHALMEGLAEDGHEVTVVSPFQVETPHKNYKQILLETSYEMFQKDTAKNNFMEFNGLYFWSMALTWYDTALLFTNWTFSSTNFQKFLRAQHEFDVIVVESCLQDALYGLSQHFKAPLIVTTAFSASKWSTDLVGSPNFASYVPHVTNHYSDHMTFWQRMYNSFSYWFEEIALPLYLTPKQQQIMEKSFPNTENWPSLEQIKRNVSLVLLNTHVTYATARPYAPNMIEVGAMHIKPDIDPLPLKIQTFLDEARDGVIYISLGSNVLLTKLPTHQRDALLNGFFAYPNVRILVKCDEHFVIPSHTESNVLIEPWFNQKSILAHKNVKLFVTHGGLLSTSEAVYYAKPSVAIPFFFDQHMNAQITQQKGHGISVPIETLNSHNFRSAVRTIMEDTSYAHRVKHSSDLFRSQLNTPLETAVHWVKHVAKNKGARYLKSVAVDLPFYALYNLDVWAFIMVAVILIAYILKTLIKNSLRIIYCGSKGKFKTA